MAPRISTDRIDRVIAGYRPYRPSGLLVRCERHGPKTVIHNHGHGGGGITLAWGASALTVRETHGLERGRGRGRRRDDGVATARLLQDAGWRVTIHARDMLRHTTSSVGGDQ